MNRIYRADPLNRVNVCFCGYLRRSVLQLYSRCFNISASENTHEGQPDRLCSSYFCKRAQNEPRTGPTSPVCPQRQSGIADCGVMATISEIPATLTSTQEVRHKAFSLLRSERRWLSGSA